MEQSKWKEKVEYLKAEMLKRGKEKDSSEILKQFSTRLSATVLHFFAESDSFHPHANLSVDQKAFTHSLQLYDLHSVMRLVGNYDVSKGLKVVIPGIEKSYRSLMVIPRLEKFTKNSLESTALGVYKFRLEDSLSSFLSCERNELYGENFLNEKIGIASSTPKFLWEKFFTERLRTLFSSNYRTYLLLKNRYFLNLLFRYLNNPKNLNTNDELKKQFSIKNMEENFDFRSVEKYVKQYIFKNNERESIIERSKNLNKIKKIIPKINSNIDLQKKQESIKRKKVHKNSVKNINESILIRKENIEEIFPSYTKLISKHEQLLNDLMKSFCPVAECSSPYFLPRAEDYKVEFSNFFRQIMGKNFEVIVAIHKFTLELLMQRGHEYNAAERWEMVSFGNYEKNSMYYRKTEKDENFLYRKTEWSILINFSMPFDFQLPMGKGEKIWIKKGKPCLFQIGTAFFDHGYQKKLQEIPDVFFKLMFGGQILTSKNAVIHVVNDPYFTTTLSQLWYCRGLIYIFFMAISERFAIELSSSLKEFLVEFLPKNLKITGVNPPIFQIIGSIK